MDGNDTMRRPEVILSSWVTRDEMTHALLGVAKEFAELLRSLSFEEGRGAVPGLDWTVAETAAHILSLPRRGTRRGATLEDLAALNATQIAEVSERDPAEIADAFLDELHDLTASMEGLPADMVFDLHLGLRADLTTLLSYVVADIQVHGHDIADATDRSWNLDDGRAALTLLVIMRAITPWVRPEVLAGPPRTIALQFATLDQPLVIEAGAGAFTVTRESPADAAPVAASAGAVLLAVAGRRLTGDPVLDDFAGWFLPI